jgi:hypothetical protein
MMPRCHAFANLCCLVVAGWLVAAGTTHAQPPSPPFEPSKANVARLRWLHYKLVAGRIVATSSYPEGMNISFGPSVVDGRLREQLQLLILKNQASVRYELSGDGNELTIGMSEAGEFQVRRSRHNPRLSFQFVQPPGKPVSLSVAEGDEQRIVSGTSFWHLYLAEPQWIAAELIPYLELLRPTWKLAATGTAVEDTLIQRAQTSQTHDTRRWAQLVAQLASSNFAERQRAERELTRIGQVVLPFLGDLKTDQLDAEQAARVDRLISTLSVDYEDTVDRVATWLAGDQQVWLSLLSRPEIAKRKVATAQLAALTGGPIQFDPLADEPTRQAQLITLRLRLGSSERRLLPPPDGTLDSVPPPGIER